MSSMTVYLNNAAEARLSAATKEVGVACVQQSPTKHNLPDANVRVRQLFAQLIGCESKHVSLMPSTAFAITLAASNLAREWRETTGKILLIQDQYSSAVYPWQDVVAQSEGRLQLLIVEPPTATTTWTDQVVAALTQNEDVLVACLPPLHWSDGALLDLELIRNTLGDSIPLIVDATQAVGILPGVNVSRWRPFMLACSSHKWLRSPSGTCAVYVDPCLHGRWSPLDSHSRGRYSATGNAGQNEIGPDGFDSKFFEDARKFDSGGRPNPVTLPMMAVAMQEVVELDLIQAQLKLKELMEPVVEWAKANDFELTSGPHAYHLVGIRPKDLSVEDMLDVLKKLAEEDVYIAVRAGAFRVSPYLDTTKEEIDRFLEVLGRVLGM